MVIDQKTKLNMVIGFPLEHSQSPLLHNAVYDMLGMNAVMLAFANQNLKTMVQSIKTLSIALTAVTMPYKEKIIKYLDDCEPEVKLLKAANTIIQREGKLYGYNTDVAGIQYALRNTNLTKKNVLIIGAGGAARAAAYVLQKKRAHLFWLNRSKSKANALAQLFGGTVVNPQQINELLLDVIINTTPVGMYPNIDVLPLAAYQFQSHQTVFDMIYNPIQTQLLKQAKKAKAKIIFGVDMFVGQGLQQIELLTNKKIRSSDVADNIRKLLLKRLK
ncbi:MAG: shikimate dehydrogenase [Gammaproteobacteria bacterium RIFCSPHIGHO2_12_FULL_41_15]|nr:MAG: shikimate dehydrogenase [Gammaproteobacteria bacterium RIFCSPHIGHO2_12_FULL_41_15]